MAGDITITLPTAIFIFSFCLTVIILLVRIGNAIIEQTKWLKDENDIDRIN